MKEMDDLVFDCENYNQSQENASFVEPSSPLRSLSSHSVVSPPIRASFVETSSDDSDDDSINLENIRISDSNTHDYNPLYKSGSVAAKREPGSPIWSPSSHSVVSPLLQTNFVEMSNDDSDNHSIDLENIEISDANTQDYNPLYMSGSVTSKRSLFENS